MAGQGDNKGKKLDRHTHTHLKKAVLTRGKDTDIKESRRKYPSPQRVDDLRAGKENREGKYSFVLLRSSNSYRVIPSSSLLFPLIKIQLECSLAKSIKETHSYSSTSLLTLNMRIMTSPDMPILLHSCRALPRKA